jgi:hypothetical protein
MFRLPNFFYQVELNQNFKFGDIRILIFVI